MAPFAERREIQFIALYIISMIFLGLSQETTQFIFPDMGDQIFKTINFYFLSVIALMGAVAWLSQAHIIPSMPKVPPVWAIAVNFLIFFPITLIALTWIFTGTFGMTVPTLPQFIIETAVSFNENFIAFILLPALLPWGTGVGSLGKGSFFTIKGYTLGFDIPDFNRLKYGIPSITIISLLHVGSYSQQSADFTQLFSSLSIAFVFFLILYFLKETFGFGCAEASHDAWNLALIGLRGAVI
jgi:hypothetical protein